MTRARWIQLGIIAWVVAEFVVLYLVERAIGVGPLLLLLIAEGLLGGALMKREGRKAWASVNAARANGDPSGRSLTDAALVLVGGFLLILPGFITDAVGALFLIPATRGLARVGAAAVIASLTKPLRDRGDLLAAHLDTSRNVPGSVVDPEPAPPSPPDSTVVRGEIVP